ncbi:UV DNA damage repair endonuclease UvsE [Desulfogranum marinum]|uniref:UV DNA damage repair endonuclease UvsE n=1 Tax=Desulfogranum marinum TaxID=453220 RepID=UPI001962A88D|nr:UV DNA damage repair endonuclease UvsE [Desulfogranum marinum]MBM9514155.1 UV DNA damage repair endonuclease UvsE [Desulfogranum marinum]
MKNIRLGLCCMFRKQPIRFRIKQAAYIMKFDREEQLEKISATILENSRSLFASVTYCRQHNIGSFRVNSRFFPLKTHPEVGYGLEELPDHEDILANLGRVQMYAEQHDIRLTFHPDQFTLLSTPKSDVLQRSIEELLYHDEMAELIGADVINIHGGGGYGDKPAALARLQANIQSLPESLRSRLTLENDDRTYSPKDLLPVCRALGIPLVYDVHHHRCYSDGLSEERATEMSLQTWNREPLFHLSSPKQGWQSDNPRPHSNMIDPDDFPQCWFGKTITVDIEAKAKELAIAELQAVFK